MARIRLEPPKNIVFATTLDVRVTDLNYGRHLGHMELVGLLHQARVRFLDAHGMTEMNVEGLVLIVVDLAVSYRSEAFIGQTLGIDIGLAFEGSRGVGFTYAVRNQDTGTLVALARTGVVFADPESHTVVQAPPIFRGLVEGRVG